MPTYPHRGHGACGTIIYGSSARWCAICKRPSGGLFTPMCGASYVSLLPRRRHGQRLSADEATHHAGRHAQLLATQPSFFGQVTLLRPDQPEETG